MGGGAAFSCWITTGKVAVSETCAFVRYAHLPPEGREARPARQRRVRRAGRRLGSKPFDLDGLPDAELSDGIEELRGVLQV